MAADVTVADYILRAVEAAGVGHVFMLPGGGAMHLNDSLARSQLGAVPCHHEQACGIAAEAYGRITENLGVAMVTTGPGATNIVTPVVGAWIESSPLLVVSGQVKRADRMRGGPLRQKGVQEVDIIPMVQHVTKYAVTIDDPSSVRFHVEKAIHLARSGRRGPVWLDVPLDVQAALVDPAMLEGYALGCVEPPDSLNAVVARTMELLVGAKNPLVLAGHGVRLAGSANRFRNLIEALGIPVATTWNAMDLIPYEHRLSAGRPGVVALRAANFAVQTCDLLIVIGCRLDNVITAYNPGSFAPRAQKVIVDVDPNELAKLQMTIDADVSVDAGTFIDALAGAVDGAVLPDWSAWIQRIGCWKEKYPPASGEEAGQPGRMSHYAFVAALSDALPPDILIATGSSGLAVEAFYSAFRNKDGQRIFLTSGLGAMGYGVPAAIGACVANRRQPMVAIESDGSLMLNIQELATLKALDLPVVLVVMNNNGYASIRNTQRNYFHGRYIGTGPEAGLLIPDLVSVATAFGLPARRVDQPEYLDSAIAEAMSAGGPVVLDVQLVGNEVLAPKVSAIPKSDGSIVSMPLEDMAPLLPLEVLREEVGQVRDESVAARANS
jgi:acetolactate synthase-1/2/3 large subunit